MIAFIPLHAGETINPGLSLKLEFGISQLVSIRLDRFKTRAMHFPKKRDERENWYATGNFRQERLWRSSSVTRLDSESIFQQQFLVNTMEMTAAIRYILSAAQSLGSQDYYKMSRRMIIGLAGVLFCKNEQAYTKWIIVCSEENTYLDACGRYRRSQSNSR